MCSEPTLPTDGQTVGWWEWKCKSLSVQITSTIGGDRQHFNYTAATLCREKETTRQKMADCAKILPRLETSIGTAAQLSRGLVESETLALAMIHCKDITQFGAVCIILA